MRVREATGLDKVVLGPQLGSLSHLSSQDSNSTGFQVDDVESRTEDKQETPPTHPLAGGP